MSGLAARAALAAAISAAAMLALPATGSAIQFQPYANYEVGSWPESVAIADVTGDGRNDVLLSTSYYFDPDNDYKLFLFAQQPNGSLAPPVQFPTHGGYGDMGLATGDLNGDGATDVALATSYGIDLFLQSAGTIDGPALVPGTEGASQLVVADVDDDGYDDMVIDADENGVLVARREGASFDVVTATSMQQEEVEVGDVTGDSRLDIVGFSSRYVRVYPQLEDGTFGGPIVYECTIGYWPNAEGIEVADVTGDGRADAVVSIGGNRPGSRINVFAQNDAGTFNPPVFYTSYDIPERAADQRDARCGSPLRRPVREPLQHDGSRARRHQRRRAA